MDSPELELRVVVEPFYSENAYIARRTGRDDCLVVDPSFESDQIIQILDQNGIEPAAILNTHGHADHIAGNFALKERFPNCPLIIGQGDAAKLTNPVANLSRPFGMDIVSPAADRTVSEGETLSLAGFDLDVLETPGHSSGHVVFVWRQSQPQIVFGGGRAVSPRGRPVGLSG